MPNLQKNHRSHFSRRWLIFIVAIVMLSTLGCSLARRMVRAQVLAAGPTAVQQPETPTRTPRPTFTPSPLPTSTPTQTSTPTDTATATVTPTPTDTATATVTPTATDTPLPTSTFTPAPPTATPTVTFTPLPTYDYITAEVFNEYTSNSFLTVYVAIVSTQDIPIGGVKVVGSFDPGGYHHQSLVSKWHFEGYTAPGYVTKTSSVKFEPPGGILPGAWFIHLENEGGGRLSEDVAIPTDPDNARWYYVKFKRKF